MDKATRKKIFASLDDKQVKRLKEIELQQQGVTALDDEEVAQAINLTDQQKDQIKKINEEQARKVEGQGQPRLRFAKLREVRAETETRINEVLTDAQKKQLEEMKGEKFELRRLQLRLNINPAVPGQKVKPKGDA